MRSRILAAVVLAVGSAPLAAQTADSPGQRWGDRLHDRNTRDVVRTSAERVRLNPSPNPRVGPTISDGYIVLPDTTIVNPAVSGIPRPYR